MSKIIEIQKEKFRQNMTCKQFLQLARREQNENCRLKITNLDNRQGTLVKVEEHYGILFDDGCIEDPDDIVDAKYVDITFLTKDKDKTEKVVLSNVEMVGQKKEEKDEIITKILNKKLNIENLNSLYKECKETLTEESEINEGEEKTGWWS